MNEMKSPNGEKLGLSKNDINNGVLNLFSENQEGNSDGEECVLFNKEPAKFLDVRIANLQQLQHQNEV